MCTEFLRLPRDQWAVAGLIGCMVCLCAQFGAGGRAQKVAFWIAATYAAHLFFFNIWSRTQLVTFFSGGWMS